MKHCDEYIDDESAPLALRTFLKRAREPAHGHLNPEPFPTLFATYNGVRVRVTMASRLGDVGISSECRRKTCTANHGYNARVWLEQLTDISEDP